MQYRRYVLSCRYMKTFTLKSNIQFDAENIDDAFGLLAAHFDALKHGEESVLEFIGGEIEIVAQN